MSTKSPWILTDAQRENITVYQCTPLEDGPRAGFYWAYKVLVGGCTYQGRHPHPTRRAAWAAAKSFFKVLSEKQGLRDSPIAEPQQQ